MAIAAQLHFPMATHSSVDQAFTSTYNFKEGTEVGLPPGQEDSCRKEVVLVEG